MTLSVASLSMIIKAVEDSQSTDHGSKVHHVLGFLVNCLLVLHVIFAVFRPKKPKGDEQISMQRKVWKFLHGCNGVFMYVLANINIILGILLKGEIGLVAVHIVWITIVTFGLIFFEWGRSRYSLFTESASSDDDNINGKIEKSEAINRVELSERRSERDAIVR